PPPGLVVHPALSPGLEGAHPTGAGVAFLLLWQVYQSLGLPPPLEFTDLAAIGTVADVAPLQGFNRALVQEGLRRLRDSTHLGLRELASAHCQDYTAEEVAFRIAPRINAASRLGQAEVGLELLTTEDPLQARPLAEALSQLNAQRQRIEEEMLKRIETQLDPCSPALVIHDPEGHPGVMGIVASRVLERHHKPVFIIAQGKGSVRSTPGISAVGALRHAQAYLKRFGGHAQAAGFAIEEAHIPGFAQAIQAYVARFPTPVREIELDGWLDGEDLAGLHRAIGLLEPTGEGNPKPLFYLRGRPEGVRLLGEGRHLSFRLGGLRVLKWRDSNQELPDPLELAAELVLNRWNGEENLELWAAAYRPASPEASLGEVWAVPIPLREGLEQALKERARVYVHPQGAPWFSERGLQVVPPDQAAYWFSLPEDPAYPPQVRIALSERAQNTLGNHPDRLVRACGQRVVAAYRLGSAALLSESLERYWQALLSLGEASTIPASPAVPPR
ncbi:MAG: single-stranded-DNA-specific exonuclease RecJ, partial [Deinococcus-Thermus bacterium]